MSYRQTWVIEYADESAVPSATAGMQALGGVVVAVQFSDAVAELAEALDDNRKLRDVWRTVGRRDQ